MKTTVRRRECLVCELRWSTWEVGWNPTQIVDLLEILEQNQKAIIRRIAKKLAHDGIQLPGEPALDSGGAIVPCRSDHQPGTACRDVARVTR